MPSKVAETDDAVSAPATAVEDQKKQRDIPGSLPYTGSQGVLKKVLEGITKAERPDKFSSDFMETVLNVSGGAARAVPPILKKMGFLGADGSPTDLYSKFKSDSSRSGAALEGLRRAFAEMFRRNEFIYRADNDKIRDLIVEITGLNKQDGIVRAISGTFGVIKEFVDASSLKAEDEERKASAEIPKFERTPASPNKGGISLAYNINIILPETTNIQVFNAIFRSLKENLLGEDA